MLWIVVAALIGYVVLWITYNVAYLSDFWLWRVVWLTVFYTVLAAVPAYLGVDFYLKHAHRFLPIPVREVVALVAVGLGLVVAIVHVNTDPHRG